MGGRQVPRMKGTKPGSNVSSCGGRGVRLSPVPCPGPAQRALGTTGYRAGLKQAVARLAWLFLELPLPNRGTSGPDAARC